ncbi:unnamed protein product [Fraxinus pennsylvanica]|uniref:Uncharacterized protein n=1 Tax=Fraxinus pennsylvanica TaxID=56036 RepID=A0AAD1YNY4_9LAMI|nr:unnamed protein product [Fraxinus pennsylvanica]
MLRASVTWSTKTHFYFSPSLVEPLHKPCSFLTRNCSYFSSLCNKTPKLYVQFWHSLTSECLVAILANKPAETDITFKLPVLDCISSVNNSNLFEVLAYSFKKEDLWLQVSSFADGKNIIPASNFLDITY